MKSGSTAAVLIIVLAGCATMSDDNRLATSGYEYIKQGDMRAAERELNAALDANPDNPFALLNLGVVYQETGRTEDARREYLRVMKLDSSDIAARSTVNAERGEKLVDIAARNLDLLK